MCKYKHNLKVCSYPSIYHIIKRTLLIDEVGLCLFHSQNLIWKAENNFEKELEILSQQLVKQNANKPNEEISFRGIIFPMGKYQQLWENKIYSFPLNFSDCVFHCPIYISDSEFKTLDFSTAVFKQRFYCKNSQFNQLVYSKEAVFENGMYLENCTFSNSVFFDKCQFNNEQNKPIVDLSIKNTVFKKPLDFSGSIFNLGVSFFEVTLDGADFSEAEFYKEFFVDKSIFSKTVLFQRTEFFYTENFGGHMSSVDLKNIHLNEAGKIIFQGKEPFYDQVKGEIFLSLLEVSKGIILIENFNLNKFENNAKLKLFELEKSGQVEIGNGCRKYRHQTPPKKINLQKGNQSLVTELTNTFVEFFKSKNGINLGVEVTGRSDDFIEIIYFTDENISFEEFREKLNLTEQEMWTLVKISSKSVHVTPSKSALPDKLIGATDTLINLAALMLKISARIPLLKINRQELSELIQSTSFGATPSIENATFETLSINQTILLGVGNSQEVKL